jgi:DNA-binding Lrp family transcriptional regulator
LYGVRVGSNAVQSRRTGEALRTLRRACRELTLQFVDDGATATVEGLRFDVLPMDLVAELTARDLARQVDRYTIVSARRITEDARAVLRKSQIAFLDERGHVSIRRAPLIIEAAFQLKKSPTPRASRPLDGIGLDVAMWLMHTSEPMGVRAIARQIGRTASSVSDALRRLVHEGLVTTDHEPVLPELFEMAVEAWRYRSSARVRVTRDPRTTANADLLETHLDDPAGPGWAHLGGTAERAWEVPGIERFGDELQLMVPDLTAFDLGSAVLRPAGPVSSQFELVVAPVAWLSRHRVVKKGTVVIPAIAIALELAMDPARGRELLAGWNPEGARRVW